MKRSLYIFIPLILSGCGESVQVKEVKSLVYDYIDSSITVGNALDNRPICKNTDWKTFKDDRNRNIVEYTCDLKLEEPNEFLSNRFDDEVKSLDKNRIYTDQKITESGLNILSSTWSKNKYVKDYPDAELTKFININATDYLVAEFMLDKYKQSDVFLDSIADSELFKKYQIYKKYFLENQKQIEQALSEYEDGYFGFSRPYQKLYGLSPYRSDGIISVMRLSRKSFDDQLFFTNLIQRLNSKDTVLKNNVIGLLDIQKKLAEKNLKTIEDKNIEQAYLKLFDSSYQPIFYKDPKSNEGVKVQANNYSDFLQYIMREYQGIMDSTYKDIIIPYNDTVADGIIEIIQLKVKTKIRHYQQKIQWSVIENKEPTFISCQLFINDKLVDDKNSVECFRASYSGNYVSSFYNRPLSNMHFALMFNEIINKKGTN